MTNRCKPGDLAVVIQAKNSVNLGRIVKVLRLDDRSGPLVYGSDLVVWLAECASPMTWKFENKVYKLRQGPIPDCQLQPIRKLPAPKVERTADELEVV